MYKGSILSVWRAIPANFPVTAERVVTISETDGEATAPFFEVLPLP